MTVLDQALQSERRRSDQPRRRRRWPWIASGVGLVLAVAVGIGTAVFQFGLLWWMGEGDRNHRYESDIGSQRYQVHLPPQYDGTTRLPVIMAIHGCGMTEEDDVVPPLVAIRLVAHWTAVSDLVDDGLLNDSLDLVEATTTVPADAGRHAYTHTTITTPDGASVVESYLVHGMGHVWPGPAGRGLFTDRAGPDASAIIWDFARRHPRGAPL